MTKPVIAQPLISADLADNPQPERVTPETLAAMKELLNQLPEVQLAHIEAGPLAIAAIKNAATPASTGPGLPLSPIWGVPLVGRDDFGHIVGCCWRGVGTDGSTMREGCVIDWERVTGLDAHAATEQASEETRARLEADSQWRRAGGERRG